MTWAPINGSNAIERVRILIQFKDPMHIQQLDEITKSTLDKSNSLGFEEKIRAKGIIQNVPVDPENDRIVTENVIDGWILKKETADNHGKLGFYEEAGFRKHVFGYAITKYTNWNSLASKFWKVFSEPLSQAIDICEISSIRLEYWDKFLFSGNAEEAKIADIIEFPDAAIPDQVLEGESMWHSHIGWFENIENFQTLIQRNIDVLDERPIDDPQRVLNMYTLVEMRDISPENMELLKSLLNNMQRRSIIVFGKSLVESMRKKLT